MSALLDYLPRGNTLSDAAWQRRHHLLQAVLALHLPLLFAFGLARGFGVAAAAETLAAPLICLMMGRLLRSRRPASLFITAGLVYCSAALVAFSDGAIEAHFHFFIIIGFIALYQDWVPFLLNIVFTVLSHGIGSSLVPDLMFNHPAAQHQPWTWSLIHGVAVLAACVGVVLFWRTTEEEQQRSLRLTEQLSAAELSRRRFTSDLLVNLARRNQNLLHRQLSLLNQLEDKEHDPDALADLFRLDHLATRIRRNAESLLVLSGEDSPRTWRGPVPLVDVVRAAIAEIEDMDRVDFAVDESLAVSGRGVADLTHLLAELIENAVHFSPPGVSVMLRSRPYQQAAGAQVITIEDWGVGMTPAELAHANDLLRRPRDVDLSVSQRLGLHVVARLAQRYGIAVELTATPGGGVTAVVLLPHKMFTKPGSDPVGVGAPVRSAAAIPGRPAAPPSTVLPAAGPDEVPDRRPAPVGATRGDLAGAARPPAAAPHAAPAVAAAPAATGGSRRHRRLPWHRRPPRLPWHRRRGRLASPRRPAARTRAGPARAAAARRGRGRRCRGGRPVATCTGTPPPAPRPRSRHRPSRTAAAPPSPPPPPSRPPATPRTAAGPTGGPGRAAGNGRAPDPAPIADPVELPEPRPPADQVPAQAPAPARAAAPAAAPPDRRRPPGRPADRRGGAPQLSRRVPQANLAAGLRRAPAAPASAEPAAVRDPVAARDALSRFQASQRAARSALDEEQGR